jgi:hypothetical protein
MENNKERGQAVSDALYSGGFSDLGLYDAADAGRTGDIANSRTFFVVKNLIKGSCDSGIGDNQPQNRKGDGGH